MPQTFTLPDFYAEWPFRRDLNPQYESAAAASKQWVEDFDVLGHKAQAAFNRCNFSLLASLVYSKADPAHLRGACDLINWYFVFDELSDVSDGASARELASRLTDILKDPLMQHDRQSSLEQMTASFWSRCLEYAHPTSARRVVESMKPYIEAVCQEAEDRDHRRVRNIDDYLALRRGSAGIEPSLYFIVLPKDFPDEIMNHPLIKSLTSTAVDMMIFTNDVCSYNYERSHGLDEHNLVSVVIAEKGLDVQSAMDFVGEWYHGLSRKFVEDMNNVSSFPELIDRGVSEYVSGLGNAVTGYIEWAFETERYFGTKGPEIKSSGIVELLPRKLGDI